MKRLEQTSHPGRNQVSEPGESVPIAAARIFGNYVFVPAARLPHEGEPTARLKGAALLVFPDQSAQQIELGARDAAHVAGDAALRPREDTRDQIMSFQNKEYSMTSAIHCSACQTDLQPGNQFCPGCGLQLMAQAKPTIYVEGPRFSFWAVIIAAIAIAWAALYFLGR